MNILETLGQARMIQDEGNRLLASALVDGTHRLIRHLKGLLGKAAPAHTRRRTR